MARALLKNRLLIFLGLTGLGLALTTILAYLAITRISAEFTFRWLVEKGDLPLIVHKARWSLDFAKLNFSELKEGKIRELELELELIPTGTLVWLITPVEFSIGKERVEIKLRPTWRIKHPRHQWTHNLPPMESWLEISATLQHQNYPDLRRSKIENLQIQGEIRTGPIKLPLRQQRRVSVKTLKTDFTFSSKAPGQDLALKTTTTLGNLELIQDAIVATLKKLEIPAELSRGSTSEPLSYRLSSRYPLLLEVTGDQTLANISVDADLKTLWHDQLLDWLVDQFPQIRRSKVAGNAKLRASVSLASLRARGKLKVDLKKLDLPKKDLLLEGLALDLPLDNRADGDWGSAAFDSLEFNGFKVSAQKISLRLSLPDQAIYFTTEQDDGSHHILRQEVFGGTVGINHLHGSLSNSEGLNFAASLEATPFSLERIQKDLCLFPERPIEGDLTLNYPSLVFANGNLYLSGTARVGAFNGSALLKDVTFQTRTSVPRMRLDFSWNDLDLHALGGWAGLGDIRGSFSGFLNNTVFALSDAGLVPFHYHLLLKGHERGGEPVRFYGRAIKSVMELLGVRGDDLPSVGNYFLKISTTYRNWFPARTDYFGFEAKSEGGWVELSTFDPPGSKNHYILYGSAFTIPLNTHGVYPVKINNDAFQLWLGSMAGYFKNNLSGESAKENKDNACKPIF